MDWLDHDHTKCSAWPGSILRELKIQESWTVQTRVLRHQALLHETYVPCPFLNLSQKLELAEMSTSLDKMVHKDWRTQDSLATTDCLVKWWVKPIHTMVHADIWERSDLLKNHSGPQEAAESHVFNFKRPLWIDWLYSTLACIQYKHKWFFFPKITSFKSNPKFPAAFLIVAPASFVILAERQDKWGTWSWGREANGSQN